MDTYTADPVEEDQYTEESYLLYSQAMDSANQVLVNEAATPEEVSAARAALEAARENLEEAGQVTEKEVDQAVLAENASANSEQNPATGSDGPASYAFNGNLDNWWHSRYGGTPAEGEVPGDKLPIYIQSGFGREITMNRLTYRGRSNGSNLIKDYEIYVANVGTGETPSDADFKLAVKGTFTETNDRKEVTLPIPVKATHFRLKALTKGGGGSAHVTASDIHVYELEGYTKKSYAVSTEAVGKGTVSATGYFVTEGGSVTLTAAAEKGYVFRGWYEKSDLSGDPVSTEAEYTITDIREEKKLYANFEEVERFKKIYRPGTLDGLGMDITEDLNSVKGMLESTISFDVKFSEEQLNSMDPIVLFAINTPDPNASLVYYYKKVDATKAVLAIRNARNANDDGYKFTLAEFLINNTKWHTITINLNETGSDFEVDGNKNTYPTPGLGDFSAKSWISGADSVIIGSSNRADYKGFKGEIKNVIIEERTNLDLHKKGADPAEISGLISECDKINLEDYADAGKEAFTAALAAAKAITAENPRRDLYNAMDTLEAAAGALEATAKYQVAAQVIGVGGTASVSGGNQEVLAGSEAVFTATPENGYLFAGWYDKNTEDAILISEDASFSMNIHGDTILYAKFAVDFRELRLLITECESTITNPGYYTEDTYQAYEDALNGAKAVSQKDGATVQEVDAAKGELEDARAHLAELDANYTVVDDAKKLIPESLADYTEESVSKLQAAIDAVELGKKISEQAEVDAMAQAIKDAVDGLAYKPANYQKVNDAIADAQKKDYDLYTESTAKAVQDAIAAVVEGKNITEQAEVDAMAQAIKDAVERLVYKPADYGQVNAAIAEAQKKDYNLYTESTAKAVQDAIAAVVEGKNITEQAAVDAMAQAIKDAVGQLVYKPADYGQVNAAIAEAQKKDYNLYTESTAKAVQDAIAAVVEGKNITEQAAVDAMAQVIKDAVGQLVYKPADYGQVNAAIEEAQKKDYNLYTESTAKAVQDAIASVVEGKNITEQAAVDAMAQAIKDAVGRLVFKPADYGQVNAAIAEAQKKDYDLYTEATVKAVQDAIAAVVEGKNKAEQAAVDAMAQAIKDAVGRLVYKPADYGQVNAAIAEAQKKDYGLYTEATVKAVQDAIAAVVEGKNITEQSEVDAMAQAINDALKALEYGEADYREVNHQIENAPDTYSLYTEASAKAVKDAIAAVVEGKKATEQAEVDAMAKAIADAVKALKFKDADYSKVDEALKKVPADLSVYTKESADAVTAAVNAVERGKDIRWQTEVNSRADAIEKAVLGLKLTVIQVSSVKTAPIPVQFHTGTAVTPAVRAEGYQAGTDYTVSYKNNTAVGTAVAVLTFKGKYAGTAEVKFEIAAAKDENYTKDGYAYRVINADTAKATVAVVKAENKNRTSVSLPGEITIGHFTYKVTEIAAKAFQNNKKIKTVKLGSNVVKIGTNAFYGCTALKNITIGSKVTSIGAGAFKNCKKMTSATIGTGVKTVGKQCFYGAKQLKKVSIKSSKAGKIGSKAFMNIAKKAVIKVPKKKVTSYKRMLKKSGIGKNVKVTK